jgi:hypothetical protein
VVPSRSVDIASVAIPTGSSQIKSGLRMWCFHKGARVETHIATIGFFDSRVALDQCSAPAGGHARVTTTCHSGHVANRHDARCEMVEIPYPGFGAHTRTL